MPPASPHTGALSATGPTLAELSPSGAATRANVAQHERSCTLKYERGRTSRFVLAVSFASGVIAAWDIPPKRLFGCVRAWEHATCPSATQDIVTGDGQPAHVQSQARVSAADEGRPMPCSAQRPARHATRIRHSLGEQQEPEKCPLALCLWSWRAWLLAERVGCPGRNTRNADMCRPVVMEASALNPELNGTRQMRAMSPTAAVDRAQCDAHIMLRVPRAAAVHDSRPVANESSFDWIGHRRLFPQNIPQCNRPPLSFRAPPITKW